MKAFALPRFLLVATALATITVFASAQNAPRFELVPSYFPVQPGGQPIGPAHGGVAIDHSGNVYISTDTERGILVFNSKGKYVRAFGPTHIHGLFLKREKGGEFLYCARPDFSEVEKIKVDGTVVWTMGYPEKSGIYANAGEFHPTNIISSPDGSIFVADGYGKKWIHKFDANRNYLKSFGGPSTVSPPEEGKFDTCHGLTVDTRGPKPMLFVCNRECNRIEYWDLDGNFVKVLRRDMRRPAAVQIKGDYAAVAELAGRVTILDKNNNVVEYLGDNPKEDQRANYGLEPKFWTDGIFNAPHGISFDKDWNVIVSEWSQFGRFTKYAIKRPTDN